MIVNLLLDVLALVLNILLLPLEAINITVDFVSSVPVVSQFIQVIAYLLPWSNILPLIIIVVLILNAKIVISFIQAVWRLLPFT